MVVAQLQGRPRGPSRRQGRPLVAARARSRPRRRGARVERRALRRRRHGDRARPRSRGLAPRRSRRVVARPGGLGGAAACRAHAARDDDPRDRRVHGRRERARARATRADARRRTRAGDRRDRRRRLVSRRHARRPRVHGARVDRQGGGGRLAARTRGERGDRPRRRDEPRGASALEAALGGRRGQRGRCDARGRARGDPLRRRRRGLGRHRRRQRRDDRDAVHPAQRRAARNRLVGDADGSPAGRSGNASRPICARPTSRSWSRGRSG